MHLQFDGEIFSWRGPAPFLFVAVPDEPSRHLKAVSAGVTYGWGVIPVTVGLGGTEWTTSLFPKDGRYLVPIKVMVLRAEKVAEGDLVTICLEIGAG